MGSTLFRALSPVAGLIALAACAAEAQAQTAPAPKEKPQPFAFADFTWLSGNPRTKESPLDTEVFTGEFRVVAFAQREGITPVIFGQSARTRWELLWRGSTLDRFLSTVRDAAVQVVPLEDHP
jgi:hypothetical protein